MTTIEKTFWDMLKASISYGRTNEATWNETADIEETFTKIETTEKEIDTAIKNQGIADPTGTTAVTHQTKASLGKKIYKFQRKLSFYAKKNADLLLLNDVDNPLTTFLQATDEDFVILSNKILKRGREYLAKLASQKVTATMLNDLEAGLVAFQKLPTNTEMVITDRKSATRTIPELIADARELLDQLDDAFEGNIEDETFLAEWFSVRKIKGRHYPAKPRPKKA